jgi:Ala-tRNA(Pro) deacylase
MIPATVEAYLRRQHSGFAHHVHPVAMTAQERAAADHVTGRRVAKPVIVRLGGKLVMAVVRATDRLNLAALEEATGDRAELVGERDFAERFAPCEPGAEPPLALFGLPIFVDAGLERVPTLVMPAGTHQDAVELDTNAWMRAEGAQPVSNLGVPVG